MKILYFTLGSGPTNADLAQIARLAQVAGNVVLVRRGDVVADTEYSGRIEASDACAGPGIPADYSGVTVVTAPASSLAADAFNVFPPTITLKEALVTGSHETQQLTALAVTINAATGLASVTNLAADASVTWTSSDTGKATVSSTGKVTTVAVGTTTLKAVRTLGVPLTSVIGTATTDLITKTAHGFVTGDAVYLTFSSGFTGLTTKTVYYVIYVSSSTFKVATTYALALAGTNIDITADGTSMTAQIAPDVSSCAVTVD